MENKMLWYNIVKVILIDIQIIGVYKPHKETLLQY